MFSLAVFSAVLLDGFGVVESALAFLKDNAG